MFLAITNDQQAQQSRSGLLPNARDILVTGGSFIAAVSLCYSCVGDSGTNSITE